MQYKVILFLVSLSLLLACAKNTKTTASQTEESQLSSKSKDYAEVPHIDLIGPKWFLREVNAKAIRSKSDIYIQFKDSSSAEGFAGCNRFNGPYSFERDKISIGSLVTTRMTCEDQELEILFLNVLSQVESYDTDSKFIYFKKGEKVIAKLEAFYL